MRNTKTSDAIRSLLESTDRALSAQDLYHLLHMQRRPVGLASIYRGLDRLAAAGLVETLRRSGQDTYVVCPSSHHHHHAMCRECGRVDLVETCDLERAEPAACQLGFHIEVHQLVYHGLCSSCHVEGTMGRH